MRKFDKDAAMRGEKVVTKGGFQVLQIFALHKPLHNSFSSFKPTIVAVVKTDSGDEDIEHYDDLGRYSNNSSDWDLVMAEDKQEEPDMFVNIYRPIRGMSFVASAIYMSKESAIKSNAHPTSYFGTFKLVKI